MFEFAFDSPWYLALLGILPLIGWFSLAGLGPMRRATAIGLRSVVFVLLVLALAEARWVRVSERLTVLYLLDQSLSVSQAQSDAMVKYVNRAISSQRDRARQDRAGVIVFGRDAALEIPPLDEDQHMPRVETAVDREQTNLAGAMKLAQGSFPHDTAKRVVIISDGNQNVGNAIEQARDLAEAGIGIDVVPIRSAAESEVAVEKVILPSEVRRGQPFDLHIVLSNTAGEGQQPTEVEGRLQIIRKTSKREQTISDQEITLEPGKRVFKIREEIDQPDFYTYEARFVPKDAGHDAAPQNNQATSFTHVRGSGQVLLLEDFEHRGDFDIMIERLRATNLEVTVRGTRPEELFTDLAQLQPFDTVVLANVPREQFSDEQIEMLVRNTQSMGSGLVMLGGENSFGAGGWTNTPLEEAMPVDFRIKNAKVAPVGALALVIDRSGSMSGGKLEMAKAAAIAAARQLGDQDYLGVVAFDGEAEWVVRLTRAALKDQLAARIQRLGAGGGTNMYPGMQLAFHALGACNASIKHMILLTDGNTEGTGYTQLAQMIRQAGITISAIAVGEDAARPLLVEIAQRGGGKFYAAKDPRALPRIFQKEARRVARPLVFERQPGFRPQIKTPHEMIQGIEQQLPPITGFVLTNAKKNPLVEISLVSPLPSGVDDNTILASWTYGLGRTAVLTTDAGKRWAAAWTGWAGYDKLFSQLVRWSMRPTGESGKFTVATDVQDGKVNVVVTALDKDDEFLNFLNLGSTVVGPDMKPIDLEIKQTAPGRYVGEFDAKMTGSYLLLISPGPRRTPLRAGLSIPYSDEFRERQTNQTLLASISATVPKQGKSGKVIDAPKDLTAEEQLPILLQTNTFRHDLARATSSQAIWPLLVLSASCLFFLDVFARRVTVSFDWVPSVTTLLRRRALGGESRPDVVATMERLRSRHAQVTDQLEQRRAGLRFEAQLNAPGDTDSLKEELAESPEAAQQRALKKAASLAPDQEPEGYTARLLQAKKKARIEMRKETPEPMVEDT